MIWLVPDSGFVVAMGESEILITVHNQQLLYKKYSILDVYVFIVVKLSFASSI